MAQCFFYRTDTSSIKKELQKYFSTGFLCDFKIISEKKTYNIHRLVLSIACPQLRNILKQDDKIDLLNLSDFDVQEVHSFISALYQLDNHSNNDGCSNILKSLNIYDNSLSLSTSSSQKTNNAGDTLTNANIDGNSIWFNTYINDKNVEENIHSSSPFSEKTVKLESISYETHCDNIEDEADEENDNKGIEYQVNNSEIKELSNSVVKGKRGRPTKGEGKKSLKCNICYKFSSELLGELRSHKETEHKKVFKNKIKASYSCELCGEFCGNQMSLKMHEKFSCSKCLLPCTYCPRRFKNNMAVSTHITKEHSQLKNVYKTKRTFCHICGKSIINYKYKYHIASHDPNADLSKFEKWECTDCGKKFFDSSDNKKHKCQRNSLVSKDNEGNSFCTLCLYQFKNKRDVLEHKKEKHYGQNEVFSCPIDDCDIEMQNLGLIKAHLEKIHYKVRKISCEICFKKFSHSNLKKKHLNQVHNNFNAEFQCEQCGKDFFTSYLLKNHKYLHHSDEKRFNCKYCGKDFKKMSVLKGHLFVHEPHLSKYECDSCGKKCRSSSSLKTHVKIHKNN